MPPAVVTLTTDFGTLDPYVAQMKGVLLRLAPGVSIHDLSHSIPPGDVAAGALFLEAAVPRFPPGTVHLVVVDPGVGGARRPMALGIPEGTLVGPDNGIFSPFLDHPLAQPVVLDRPELWATHVSRTFHGRDLFAPVAARLASGGALSSVGSPLTDPVRLPKPVIERLADGVRGEVVHVDHFGNLVTSVRAGDLPHLAEGSIEVEVGVRTVGGLRDSYDAVPAGALLALIGSTDRVEISVNRGRADQVLEARVGTTVRVRFYRSLGDRNELR